MLILNVSINDELNAHWNIYPADNNSFMHSPDGITNDCKGYCDYKSNSSPMSDSLSETCYRYEVVHLGIGIMEDIIDAAYVMTLENSPRVTEMVTRLQQLTPLSSVVVQYNKTYRNCNKSGIINTPNLDLHHAMRKAMQTALKQGSRHILLMEDDCEFLPKQFTRENAFYIKQLLREDDDIDAYLLGCIPMISVPKMNGKHMRIFRGGSTHAVLWTEKGMREFLKLPLRNGADEVYVDLLITTKLRVFAPSSPYAVQLITDTENSRNWMKNLDFVIHRHVFKSHLDGKPFYTWSHRAGMFGGTMITWLLVIITIGYTLAITPKTYQHLNYQRSIHIEKR